MSNRIVELVQELSKLKNDRDLLIEESKVKYARIDEICKVELPQLMGDDGINNITVDGVGRVSLRGDVFASISEQGKSEAFQWLRSTGKESLITETVNASTLKAAAKQWVLNGEPIPECIKITPYTAAVLVRSRGAQMDIE